jgi:hypothetical protein
MIGDLQDDVSKDKMTLNVVTVHLKGRTWVFTPSTSENNQKEITTVPSIRKLTLKGVDTISTSRELLGKAFVQCLMMSGVLATAEWTRGADLLKPLLHPKPPYRLATKGNTTSNTLHNVDRRVFGCISVQIGIVVLKRE